MDLVPSVYSSLLSAFQLLHYYLCTSGKVIWDIMLLTVFGNCLLFPPEYIYSSDVSLPPGTSPKKILHLPLSKYSLFACCSPPPLVAHLSHMYCFTLSFHFPSGLPLVFGPILSLVPFLHIPITLHPLNMFKPA